MNYYFFDSIDSNVLGLLKVTQKINDTTLKVDDSFDDDSISRVQL